MFSVREIVSMPPIVDVNKHQEPIIALESESARELENPEPIKPILIVPHKRLKVMIL